MDPFLYQYSIGLCIFFIGIFYAYKQGYLSMEGQGLRNVVILLAGLGFFAGVQGYLQYAPMNEATPQTYPCAEAADARLAS